MRSALIPLESIPSANDYSSAAAYGYVYPEIHGVNKRDHMHVAVEIGYKKGRDILRHAVPCIYFTYMILHMCTLCAKNSQVYSSILKGCRTTESVLMHYILGMDKSSKILTTNMGKKRRGKITRHKKK